MIPFGQPVLVGHYSEKRDRSYRAKVGRMMDRAIEDGRKADDMRARADNIEHAAERAIYSDDPDALERLAERLADLEAERDRWKAWNASCRRAKGPGDPAVLDARQRAELVSLAKCAAWQLGPYGEVPAYVLQNLGGNITRTRKRIESLKRRKGNDDNAD